MSWATGAFLTASVVGAVVHRSLMTEAWRQAQSISMAAWIVLGVIVLAHRALLVAQQWAAVSDVDRKSVV